MSREDLERARAHCFVGGLGDVAEDLCRENTVFGLAKIHSVQRRLGFPPDATFVGAPDATVTRNIARWKSGFGYGGRIRWTGEFAVLDEKPNACGVLVGALQAMPAGSDLRDRARALAEEGLCLDGVSLDIDIAESNHFVDVCELRTDAHGRLPWTIFFVVHSSGREFRGPTSRGPGLYYDRSPVLAKMSEVHETPWGKLSILRGDSLREWFDFVVDVQAFGLRRREAIARALFGEFEVVQNAAHQGLVAPNDANLGCYVFEDAATGDGTLYPITISASLPVHLVRPLPNLSDAALDLLGWGERAERLGLLERVRKANLVPHGGGYTFPAFRRLVSVSERGPDDRVFALEPNDGGPSLEVGEVRSLPYAYRGQEVLDRMFSLDLCAPVAVGDVRLVIGA